MLCNRCGSSLEAGVSTCARCAPARGSADGGERSQAGAARAIDPLVGVPWVVLALAAAAIGSIAPDLYRRRLASEAEANVQRIFEAEIRYFNWSSENTVAQFVSAGPTPSAVPTAAGYPATPSAWTRDPGWSALNFTINGSHRYQYRVETSHPTQGFTAIAIGDLDGDGVLSTFSRHAYLWGGQIDVSPTEIVNGCE